MTTTAPGGQPGDQLGDLGDLMGDALGRAVNGWADAVQRFWGDPSPSAGRGCRCPDDCGCGDPCACCVPRADVVVHAKVGERRVVAFALRNPRHRDREVTLDVGPWHACGGEDVVVRAEWDAASPLVLGSCERRVVRLGLDVAAPSRDEKQQRGDLAACASAYADVRFEGCARPQRVAVVVHPATCDAVEVPCDCGCC